MPRTRNHPTIRFKIGDKVWLMEDNKPVQRTVEGYTVLEEKRENGYSYHVTVKFMLDGQTNRYDKHLFFSKDELIKSL